MLFGSKKASKSPTQTLGVSGTAVYGGFIQSNESNPKLTGTQKYKTYSDVIGNVAVVAASLRYFIGLIRKAQWKVEPAEDDNGDVAEFVEDCLYDMTTPWPRVVSRSSLFKFYGFGMQEWTAKKRDDGKIGFLDIEPRPQVTIEQWDVDDNGTVVGVGQRSPQTGELIYLPRAKLVYCVDDSVSDSPEGLGLFRHIIEAAYHLIRYEQLEAFAFETDLRGIPVGRAPYAALDKAVKDNKIKPEDKQRLLTGLTSIIQSHIRSPALGLILESATYTSLDEASTPSGVRLWDMELMKGDGSPVQAVAAAIERLTREIARVFGTEGILLGEQHGSLALAREKSNNFAVLVDGTLEEIARVYEMDLVRPLLELNGIDPKLAPTLKPDKVQYREVEQITAALESLARAGAILPPDDEAINEIRDMLGISRQDPEKVAEAATAALIPTVGGKGPPKKPTPKTNQPAEGAMPNSPDEANNQG